MRTQTEPPRVVPPHNLFGDHGPRCRQCSGLGSVLRLPASLAGPTRAASQCACGGTGVDRELVRDGEYASLLRRVAELEQAFQRKLSISSQSPRSRARNSRQSWEELIAWTTVDGTAIANSASEAIMFPDVTIPANFMQYGRSMRITASGKLSTTATPTMTWALRWGGVAGTLLATTEAITMGSGVATVNWRLQGELQNRTDGALGSLIYFGQLLVHTSATAVAQNVFGVSGYDAPAPVTTNLVADTALSITAKWSAASASNTLTGMQYFLEAMN